MRRVAIIPARGGSKRLPRKNVIDFLGKPIIAYTIEAALKTQLFDKVVVSTEDDEIAEVAKGVGAETVERPYSLADDSSLVADVCLHFLQEESKLGKDYDLMCCLYATAPLRNAEDIGSTVNLVESGSADFALAVTEYHFPPHQALFQNDKDFLEPLWPDWNRMKSQEVPKMVVDNGSTYAVRVHEFMQIKNFYGERLKGYVMPKIRSIDIDTRDDFVIAESFARLK